MPGAVPVALVRLLGLLGQLDGISLKIENVSHSFHLLSHTSLTKHRGMLYSAASFNTQLERTRRTRDGRLATGNPHRQPPATYGAHQSRNSSTPPSKRTKRHDHNQPHQLGPHIHKRWTNSPPLAVVEAPVRAATIAPPTPAPVGPLGFLGQLDGISLKVENVGHGFHLLSQGFSVWIWVAHPPSFVVEGVGS